MSEQLSNRTDPNSPVRESPNQIYDYTIWKFNLIMQMFLLS
jgi:hypothetical protein